MKTRERLQNGNKEKTIRKLIVTAAVPFPHSYSIHIPPNVYIPKTPFQAEFPSTIKPRITIMRVFILLYIAFGTLFVLSTATVDIEVKLYKVEYGMVDPFTCHTSNFKSTEYEVKKRTYVRVEAGQQSQRKKNSDHCRFVGNKCIWSGYRLRLRDIREEDPHISITLRQSKLGNLFAHGDEYEAFSLPFAPIIVKYSDVIGKGTINRELKVAEYLETKNCPIPTTKVTFEVVTPPALK